ncbi:MAG TPA: hypothetical protein VJA26_18595 [Gammaproteobacteria bacterium]|nr:hypothetical protein [Gammaproteobacteria bacterium]
MKAISLWQPWASLWVAGPKVHETRGWPTKVRGWVLVHAAKHKTRLSETTPELAALTGRTRGYSLPYGALIGAVNIIDCWETDNCGWRNSDDHTCGNWADGRFAWMRDDKRVSFDNPIPYRGRQGFFDVPIDLTLPAAALNQLNRAGAL